MLHWKAIFLRHLVVVMCKGDKQQRNKSMSRESKTVGRTELR